MIQNSDDVLSALRAHRRLSRLQWNEDGVAEIRLPKSGSLFIVALSPHEVELYARLKNFDAVDVNAMTAMLEWNADPGRSCRLSIDEKFGAPALCQRLQLGSLSEGSLMETIRKFVAHMLDWGVDGKARRAAIAFRRIVPREDDFMRV